MNDPNTVTSEGAAASDQIPAGGSIGPTALHENGSLDVRSDATSGEGHAAVFQQRTVPYGALAEERARRKELQRELQNAAGAQQRLQGRLDLLHEMARQHAALSADDTSEPLVGPSEPQREPHVEPPSMAETEAQAQADAVFQTQVMQSVREVLRDRPDFLAAYQHARQARVSELCALGYAPQEALEITFDNEREVIRNAYANGRNPASVIYDYARRRGYGGATAPGGSNGAQAVSSGRGILSEAEKIALAARGQAASKSLSAAGGGSAGTLTLDALAGMSDEEFAEATKGDRWQKLFV